jgi:hypothetical protein
MYHCTRVYLHDNILTVSLILIYWLVSFDQVWTSRPTTLNLIAFDHLHGTENCLVTTDCFI